MMDTYNFSNIGKIVNLKYITILIYLALLVMAIFIYISAGSAETATAKSIVGTSQYAPLDIVSGDISSDTADQIISTLGSVVPIEISWGDINLVSDSYQKDYSSNPSGNILFKIEVPKIKTAYDIGIYNQNNTISQISVSCSLIQPVGYKCNYPIVGGE